MFFHGYSAILACFSLLLGCSAQSDFHGDKAQKNRETPSSDAGVGADAFLKPPPNSAPAPQKSPVTGEPTPDATTQPTPVATTQPTPVATTQPTPVATTQPTPVATIEPGVIKVNILSCARHASCALTGTKPGQYHPLLNTDKSQYRVNETISMQFSEMPGGATDWITVVPTDFEDNSWCEWFWAKTPTGGYRFSGLPQGRYELRAFYGWRSVGQCEVIARKTFEVQ